MCIFGLDLPLSLKYWWEALEHEDRIAPTTPTTSESAASCWAAILHVMLGLAPPSLIIPVIKTRFLNSESSLYNKLARQNPLKSNNKIKQYEKPAWALLSLSFFNSLKNYTEEKGLPHDIYIHFIMNPLDPNISFLTSWNKKIKNSQGHET